ncbi:hypothetical protein SAMN05216464_101486 [Mucilaginibacter pineti]|uniref:Uncharacterized protein n=1 Tax=Mucilaginibacter pineti TaxID=1391627 RepID=A0A1G6U0G0_9SPHI|nr:hypothetical protein SAMN05216464_101486 [Mucilaginibacter pineti]
MDYPNFFWGSLENLKDYSQSDMRNCDHIYYIKALIKVLTCIGRGGSTMFPFFLGDCMKRDNQQGH